MKKSIFEKNVAMKHYAHRYHCSRSITQGRNEYLLMWRELLDKTTVKQEKLPDGAVTVISNYPNLEYILPGDYDTNKFEDGTW